MTRTIAMRIHPGGRSLAVGGPLEVFARAGRQALEEAPGREPPYRLPVVAPQRGAAHMASGMVLQAQLACGGLRGSVDTVPVSDGMGDALDLARENADLVAWRRSLPCRVRRVGAICSGALPLA